MAEQLHASSRRSDEEQEDTEDEAEQENTGGQSENGEVVESGPTYNVEDEDSDEEGYDSDKEAQRIGTSVLRFARRCVQTGDYCEALTALTKVIEISELASEPSRRALLFAAQVLSVTAQEHRAIRCFTELWKYMPSPYITRDAQLIIGALYERQGELRIRDYWFKKALGSSQSDPNEVQRVWLSLADRSFEQGDYIISSEAYSRVFVTIVESRGWPVHLSAFRFVGRFLTSMVSVAQVDGNQHFNRQTTAFALAMSVLQPDATPLNVRVWDLDYLLVRAVYLRHFPTIYSYLFTDEDAFIGRIQRAWRTYAVKLKWQNLIEECRRQRIEELERRKAAKRARSKPEKKKRPKAESPYENADVITIRSKTKARAQSLRHSSQLKPKAASVKSVAAAILEDAVLAARPSHMTVPVRSPTRRKLEEVKRLREPSASPTECPSVKLPTDNQTSPSRRKSPARTLLDVYNFPTLASDRATFQEGTGRPHVPADLDNELDAIEAFARLAHYRSRVIANPPRGQQVHDVDKLSSDLVVPEWLKCYNAVLDQIRTHESRQQLPQAPVSTLASHFSQIHARVLHQLRRIHQTYVLQFGSTAFSIKLSHLVRRIERWQFTSVSEEVIKVMEDLKILGEEEEAQRNLEFYHVRRTHLSVDASTT